MANHQIPSDVTISVEDFLSSGWKNILADAGIDSHSSMWQALSAAARSAMEAGELKHGKVLWLLADACSMMLSPHSPNEPFKPFMVIDGKRSALPEDFSDTDINFFAGIVDHVDDARLKARLADLVWLRQKPRNTKFALVAIENYRATPLDVESWVRDGRESWERAIGLAKMLRAAAVTQFSEMEEKIVGVFNSATRENGYLALWLSELLKKNGLAQDRLAQIAARLNDLAREFENEGDLHRARDYFSSSIEWFKVINDDAKIAEATVALAETWVKEAISRTSTDQPSHMVAASFYENAIQTYRTIPRTERTSYRVDERIAELRADLNESGEKSLGEMGEITSPGIDITQLIEHARSMVHGKSPTEALIAFVSLHRGVDFEAYRNSAIAQLRRFPLQAMFASTTISRDGRVVAKRPGFSLTGGASADDEIVIRSEMVKNYGMLIGLVVQSEIIPALEVLLLEHRLQERDFISLARRSPIVPPGRERLFGKALAMGYDTDFAGAIHVLVPQIEHMVRFHLKQAGVKTTNLDSDGIENENGLSTLMKAPEVDEVFGKNIAFEIRAIFCDEFGPNLRNELAHGLLDDEMCQSSFAIYAWWLALKLVLIAWWNAGRAKQNESSDTSESVEQTPSDQPQPRPNNAVGLGETPTSCNGARWR